MPAPDVEILVLKALYDHLKITATGPDPRIARDLLDKNVGKIIVWSETIEIYLLRQTSDGAVEAAAGAAPRPDDKLTLGWQPKPFVAVKGVTHAPAHRSQFAPQARDALLEAIAKARAWIDELVEGKVSRFAEIAKREGKGERQIRLLAPLAFVAPKIVQSIVEGTAPIYTVTELAKSVPWTWVERGCNLN